MSFRRVVCMCERCCTRTLPIWELPSRSMTRGSLSVDAIGLANGFSTSGGLRENKMIKLRWGMSGGRRVVCNRCTQRMHESILIIHNRELTQNGIELFFFIELSPSISIPKCGNWQSIKRFIVCFVYAHGRKRFRLSSEQRLKFKYCSFLDIRAQPKRIHSPFPHCNFFVSLSHSGFCFCGFSFFFSVFVRLLCAMRIKLIHSLHTGIKCFHWLTTERLLSTQTILHTHTACIGGGVRIVLRAEAIC